MCLADELPGNLRSPMDLSLNAHLRGCAIGAQHGVRRQQGNQSVQISTLGGVKERLDNRPVRLPRQGMRQRRWRRLFWRARLASLRVASGERSMMAEISSNGRRKRSCSTKVADSSGERRSSACASASYTDSSKMTADSDRSFRGEIGGRPARRSSPRGGWSGRAHDRAQCGRRRPSTIRSGCRWWRHRRDRAGTRLPAPRRRLHASSPECRSPPLAGVVVRLRIVAATISAEIIGHIFPSRFVMSMNPGRDVMSRTVNDRSIVQEGNARMSYPALIVMPVSNIETAKATYRALLGIDPYVDSPYYVGFKAGDGEIGLDPNGTGWAVGVLGCRGSRRRRSPS